MKLSIRWKWWFKFYLMGVSVMCILTRREVDPVKFKYWVRKGATFEISPPPKK